MMASFDAQSAQDRLFGRLGRTRILVLVLDEQPFRLRVLESHERPDSAELVAVERKEQLALLESGLEILEWRPLSTVPHDDLAGAVVAGWDDSLEVGVIDRVILGLGCEALLVRIVRRSPGHCPRHEDAVPFEPKVEVQPRRRVLVDDEQMRVRR
jgi:hypothetical protein